MKFGDPIALPAATVVTADGKALVDIGNGKFIFAQYVSRDSEQSFNDSAVADDARVLPLRRSAGGDRERTWTSVADACREEGFGDWPVSGPRTAAWCLNFLKKEGRTLELHHERFKQVTKAEASGWGIPEHRELCTYLTQLCLYDQLDASNVAASEMMFRRIQTIEFSYLEKVRDHEAKAVVGGRMTLEEQAIFGGLSRADSALMLSPGLLDHARAEAEKQASLAKNLRKAREERTAGKKQ